MLYKFIILLLIASGNISYGSEAQSCSSFTSADKQSFLLKEAYKSSDLVVIGEIAYTPKPILKIKNKIKGNESKKEVELTTNICHGTACSGGFSVAPKVDLFFLLKKTHGIYDSVSGNGNYSCPVVYEVENNFVKFKDKKISIQSLVKYLESNPDPVPLF